MALSARIVGRVSPVVKSACGQGGHTEVKTDLSQSLEADRSAGAAGTERLRD